MSKKRTLVITGGDSRVHSVLDLTIPSKFRYSQQHGYDFNILRSFKSLPNINVDAESLIGLGFSRTIYAFQMLEHYDVVMWLDSDSIVTNSNLTIDDFIDDKHTIYFSYDWPVSSDGSTGHVGFSGGNFIIKSTKYVEELFSTFVNFSQHFLNDVGSDQTCFNVIYNQTPLKQHFKILEHNYLNAVPESILTTNTWASDPNRSGKNKTHKIINPWTGDSFIAHLTGCTSDDRINLLNTYFKKYL